MKPKFYTSARRAYAAAKKRREVGLTGSGQECLPVQFGEGEWAYKTWDGRYLIPGGELENEWVDTFIYEQGIPVHYSLSRQ